MARARSLAILRNSIWIVVVCDSHASDENAPGYWNILTNDKFHVYGIFCILLILIFLFFIILFLIIFRFKNSVRKRSKGKNGITKNR